MEGALLAVVAQNTRLKIELPEGIEVRQVFGREQPLKPKQLDLPVGDLTSGEQRVLLLKLHTDQAAQTGIAVELKATLTYDHVQHVQRSQSEQVLSLQRSDVQPTQQPPSPQQQGKKVEPAPEPVPPSVPPPPGRTNALGPESRLRLTVLRSPAATPQQARPATSGQESRPAADPLGPTLAVPAARGLISDEQTPWVVP